MNLIKKIIYLLLLTGFFTACDNKVDINAEYHDITVVYGLLDQSQPRQYIKITRAFQTEGNVLGGAADSSFSQYAPQDVEAFIDEYSNGTFIRTIPLDTFLVTDKDSGTFYYPNQIVYVTPDNTFLNAQNEYELNIKIKSLNKKLTSKTLLIHDFSITKPNYGQKYVGFTSPLPQTVEWRSAENGKLYQMIIRFYYTEKDANNKISSHFIDIPLNSKESQNTRGGEKMSIEFYGEIFYQSVAAKVPLPENGMVRYADSIFYIFSVADENFAVYMDVNKPSGSIVQERPAFTNIQNGMGIFAGRYNKKRSFLGLTPQSLDTLIGGQYTYRLGFKQRPNP